MKSDQPQLPLREPTFFILLSLSPGPLHGYAIMKEVSSLSHGRISLSTGTLYGAIKRLLDQNWIKRVDDPIPNESSRVRKAYTLTDNGQRALKAEIKRLRTLVDAVQTQTSQETA